MDKNKVIICLMVLIIIMISSFLTLMFTGVITFNKKAEINHNENIDEKNELAKDNSDGKYTTWSDYIMNQNDLSVNINVDTTHIGNNFIDDGVKKDVTLTGDDAKKFILDLGTCPVYYEKIGGIEGPHSYQISITYKRNNATHRLPIAERVHVLYGVSNGKVIIENTDEDFLNLIRNNYEVNTFDIDNIDNYYESLWFDYNCVSQTVKKHLNI